MINPTENSNLPTGEQILRDDFTTLQEIERAAMDSEMARFARRTPEFMERRAEPSMYGVSIADTATRRTIFPTLNVWQRLSGSLKQYMGEKFPDRLSLWVQNIDNATKTRQFRFQARYLARSALPTLWTETLQGIKEHERYFREFQESARRLAREFAQKHGGKLNPTDLEGLTQRLFPLMFTPIEPTKGERDEAAKKNPILREAMREFDAKFAVFSPDFDPAAPRIVELSATRTFAFHWPSIVHEWETENAARLGTEHALTGPLKDDPYATTASVQLRVAVTMEMERDEFKEEVPWPLPVEHAETEADGMPTPGSAFVAYLQKRFIPRGEGAAKETIDAIADRWRSDLSKWKAQRQLEGMPAVSPWRGLTPRLFASLTAQVIWFARLRGEIEREAEREHGVVRVGSSLADTFALARAHGGRIVDGGDQSQILISPPSGTALMLPFDDGLRVTGNGGTLVGLRQVLTLRAQRTYLATLVLFQDQGQKDDGSFSIDGFDSILEVTGATRHKNKSGKRTYERYATKDLEGVEADLRLLQSFRVRSVGDLEAAVGDALVDRIENVTDRRFFYAHSRLVAGQLWKDYFRIPRQVCRLDSDDIPTALGIARIVRDKITRHIQKGALIEAPILEWLEAAGIDAKERLRQRGPAVFWPAIADTFARVTECGQIGTMAQTGIGRDLILTLTPDANLRKSYGSLVAKAKEHATAKRVALVADKRKPRKGKEG